MSIEPEGIVDILIRAQVAVLEHAFNDDSGRTEAIRLEFPSLGEAKSSLVPTRHAEEALPR